MNLKLKIIVYLRRQDLFLQSLWAQGVKSGARRKEFTFDKYIKLNKNCLDYHKRCCQIRDIVGEGNIIVRVYEKQQFEGINKDLLTDFLKAIGYNYNKPFVLLKNTVNPSLSGIYLETKNILNKYDEFNNYGNFIISYLIDVAENHSESGVYSKNKLLAYKKQMELLGKYENENRKVAEEFLGRKDGVLFRDEIISDENEKEKYTTDDFVEILGEIILMQHKKLEKKMKKLPWWRKKKIENSNI